MGFKSRNVNTRKRIAGEMEELLGEVVDVISDENEQTGACLQGYIDGLLGKDNRMESLDSDLRQSYSDGFISASTDRKE